ncbi:MAG: 7TM diverse intracellular signaling domain-containing protein [Oligoflexus sp.]
MGKSDQGSNCPFRACYKSIVTLILLISAANLAFGNPDRNGHHAKIFRDLSDPKLWSYPIALRGTWEFYPGVEPAKIDENQEKLERFNLPGNWTLGDKGIGDRWASWRIFIKVPKGMSQLVLKSPSVHSELEIYINDQIIAKKGGTKRYGELKYYAFSVPDQVFSITISTRNPDFRRFGQFSAIEISTPTAAIESHSQLVFVDGFLLSALFIFGLYHIVLYALRKKNQAALWFGFLCIILALRTTLSSKAVLFLTWFPDISIKSWKTIEYLTFYWSVFSMAKFVRSLYPHEVSAWVSRYTAYLALLLSVYALANETRVFSQSIILFQIWLIVISLASIFYLYKASKNGKEGINTFLLGFLAMVICSIIELVITLVTSNVFLSISSFGLYIFIFMQGILLARNFNLAYSHLEQAEQEISVLNKQLIKEHSETVRLNKNLERIVEEKTRDIKHMMAHIRMGLMSIDKSLSILPDYSLASEALLHEDNLSGKNINTVLVERSTLSDSRKSEILNVLHSIIDMPSISFTLNSNKLPREINLAFDGHVYELEWDPVVNSSDEIEKLLLSIKDVTQIRSLKEKAEEKNREMSMVFQIVKTDTYKFERFMRSCLRLIHESETLLNTSQGEDADILKILFINMHTIKGNAKSFGFEEISRKSHDLETLYQELATQRCSYDKKTLLNVLAELKKLFDEYRYINDQVIARGIDRSSFEVSPHIKDLAKMFDLLMRDISLYPQCESLQKFFPKLLFSLYRPAHDVLTEILEGTKRVAKDLGKPAPLVSITSGVYYLSVESEELLLNIFNHLIRNTMDHGIESAQVRTEKGKPEHGKIAVDVEEDSERNCLRIFYSDDGQGLNITVIEQKAISLGLIPAHHGLKAEGLAQLIFTHGFSTAGSISSISGRGVGMDSIRSFLKDVDGDIEICLQKDSLHLNFIPFTTIVSVPSRYYLNLAHIPSQLTNSLAG